MATDVKIPELGESIVDGVIARWLKRDGDLVQADEPVLELETDKATVEIPASATGRLEIVEREGTTVRVGAVVARIAEAAERPAAGGAPPAAGRKPERAGTADGRPARRAPAATEPRLDATGAPQDAAANVTVPPHGRRDAQVSPRGEAAETDGGATSETPRAPAGRQPAARPSKDAERDHVAEMAAARVEAPPDDPDEALPAAASWQGDRQAPSAAAPPQGERRAPPHGEREAPPAGVGEQALPAGDGEKAPPLSAGPRPARPLREETDEVERTPMSRLRQRIAERLVEAQRTAAILTTFNEVDLSRLLAARQRHRERFRARHGVDLGLVALFGRACLLALADVSILNARIDGGDIVQPRRVHLGIAVSTRRGLVVPVIRGADRLSLAEMERAIEDLARRAREAKLTPDDLAGGTFTITNGGVFGSLLSTPILNPPQSGILGMHKIEDRPVAVDGQVMIRPMMYVALSYDHRLVDGEQAVTFLVRVKERLEDPVRMLFEV
jgi:2-oxoglutarate dehydrogenase E2 component (dihydrolipoamide succinyltransferase)